MAQSDVSPETRLQQAVEVMERHEVEYLVIGGQAEWLMGSPRLTYDTDLCHRRTPENLERVAAALRELEPTLRGAPPNLPFQIDARALSIGANFTFDTTIKKLDLLSWVEPIGTFENLLPNAETYAFAGFEVRTIGLDDLIRVKEHICRQKDSESLHQLRAIKEVRERTGLR